VTADDLNWILSAFNIDLELPEVFDVFDQFIDPGYTGSHTYSETHQLFEIKACKMITDTFGIPIGDHCSLQVNAVASPTLKQAPGNNAKVQYCRDIVTPAGSRIPDPVCRERGHGEVFRVEQLQPVVHRQASVRVEPDWARAPSERPRR